MVTRSLTAFFSNAKRYGRSSLAPTMTPQNLYFEKSLQLGVHKVLTFTWSGAWNQSTERCCGVGQAAGEPPTDANQGPIDSGAAQVVWRSKRPLCIWCTSCTCVG